MQTAHHLLMFTVVSSAKSSSNVSPAGTVNELMLTVVHFTASATSDIEEMVPVQEVALGAATVNGSAMDRRTKACDSAIVRLKTGLRRVRKS